MLVRAVPEAVRLTARMGERADEILRRLPTGLDAFAFHINLTDAAAAPVDRQILVDTLTARQIVSLNASVTDISKTNVHAQCRAFGLPTAATDAHGDPAELVIVKTNQNYGGKAERQLPPADGRLIGSAGVSLVMPDWQAYQVTPRGRVPEAWWGDRTLAIERFIGNSAHHLYRVNFAGDRAVILRLTNQHQLKKIYNSTARLDIYCRIDALRTPVVGVEPSVAAAIVRYIERSGMDFGALEIIPDDDGNAYVIDVSSTCYARVLNLRILAYLRSGLFARIASRSAHLGRPVARWRALSFPTWRMLRGDVRRIANRIMSRATHQTAVLDDSEASLSHT